VAADEPHPRQPDAGSSLDVGERVQPLGREAFRQDDQVGTYVGVLGELGVRVGDEALHGLGRETAPVADGEPGGSGREALIGQDGGWGRSHEKPFRRDTDPRVQRKLISAPNDVKVSVHDDIGRH
jgi:hypothetical protein